MTFQSVDDQKGSMKVGCLVAAAVAVVLVLIVGGMLVGRYNGLVTLQEKTEA